MDAVKCKGWVDIMDINQITYSLNLAETLNFTQVARRSGVTKPSLTNSIRELEKDLGGQSLYRDGKNSKSMALGREV